MKINFKQFVPALMAILGLNEWSKQEDKSVLLAEEREKLKKAGFTDAFLDGFVEALEKDFADDSKPSSPNQAEAVVSGLLADMTAKYAKAQEEIEALKSDKGSLGADIYGKAKQIKALEEKIAALSAMAENEPAAHKNPGASAVVLNWDDDKQVGGLDGALFATEGRPYNQRLRAHMLSKKGVTLPVPTASSLDYKQLKDDLGEFYRIPWKDRLQSFLVQLPTLETLFPLESGYQDLATLVNIWLGEFSQSDNTESDFDNVAKGSYDFGSETLRMYSVMFAHKFKNLKELERTWIGSYNREGSQVIKWSFVEYILAETAKKLHNERELRRINGVRKDPEFNKAGRAMDAADGLYEYIRKRVDGFLDVTSGKTVYQIKPFALGDITPENIGAKIYEGTSMIPAVLRDSGKLCLYLPSHLVTLYHKYNELHYGTNQDYAGTIMHVKEYPSVKLVSVPNADNHNRLIWTLEGNIKCYEDTPGEMLHFNIEQQDWTLKVWANWKESIQAEAVGYKYESQADMDYSRQLIFCNEYDLSSKHFLESVKDKNPSVSKHTSIVTVANTTEFAITDIEDAKVGVVVTLKCGSTDKGVKIEKSDNFSLISFAWKPKKGDVIKLMKRADGKFIELARSNSASSALMFAANDATPSVKGASVFVTDANTQATAITDLIDGVEGRIYTIHGNGAEHASTITGGDKFVVTAKMILSAGKYIKLVKTSGGVYHEVERG